MNIYKRLDITWTRNSDRTESAATSSTSIEKVVPRTLITLFGDFIAYEFLETIFFSFTQTLPRPKNPNMEDDSFFWIGLTVYSEFSPIRIRDSSSSESSQTHSLPVWIVVPANIVSFILSRLFVGFSLAVPIRKETSATFSLFDFFWAIAVSASIENPTMNKIAAFFIISPIWLRIYECKLIKLRYNSKIFMPLYGILAR